ncbi:DUF4262 domain-containing protein [Streptosporangium sp. NPDC020072]|uniref:DUF4262 domain-containing protein n=1 Tax=Streptosporangium sp. NPDC020072 TaxID=3154788 RepID=UPI003419A767
MQDHEIARTASYDHLSELIQRYGWAVKGVVDQGTPWYYTIGLSRRNHPELVVVGLSPEEAASLLNQLALAARGGVNVLDTTALAAAWGHPKVFLQLRQVDPTWSDTNLFNTVRSYLGAVPPAYQVVLADIEGHFPWDEGHSLGFEQRVLWEPWPEGWPGLAEGENR